MSLSGGHLPDDGFVRIPHGAVKRRRPSAKRTPLYGVLDSGKGKNRIRTLSDRLGDAIRTL